VSDSLVVNGHAFFVVLEIGQVASNREPGWQASRRLQLEEEKETRDLAVLAGLQEFWESLPPASRLIGLDLGEKTIGIALSDTRRTVASPLVTRKRTKFAADFAALTALVVEHGVGGLVIGLPLNMNGTEGPSAQSARAFARNYAARSDTPLLLWDERLSTAAVTRTLLDADTSRKRRAELVDKLAAAWLLQGALDALHNLSRAQST
jgi:putative Holliday junction resolvase